MMKLHCFDAEKLYKLLKESCLKESQFWTDRKEYPITDDIVTSNERDDVILYLLETCDREDVNFSLETFGLSVSLLDRFLASFKVKIKYLECLALACLYIASKVKEEKEKILSSANFLDACNAKFSLSELLRMELMVLSKFNWSINDVTVVDFVYLYHALLVDKYRNIKPTILKDFETSRKSKWQKLWTENEKNEEEKISAYPPHDLDFLHLVEKKIKQCLCFSELTVNFKPHVLGVF